MKRIKFVALLLISAIGITSIGGCARFDAMKKRTEPDEQYAQLMLSHMEDRYKREFEIVSYRFPKETVVDEYAENILMLKDVQTGLTTHAYSYLGKPYDFYDSFASDYASYLVSSEVNTKPLKLHGTGRLYLYLRNENFESLDVSSKNVSRAVMVINIPQRPEEDNLMAIYQVYQSLQELDYEKKYLLVGFTEQSTKFTDFVNFYRVYGVKKWSDYGWTYAKMSVKEAGLSYEEFIALIC